MYGVFLSFLNVALTNLHYFSDQTSFAAFFKGGAYNSLFERMYRVLLAFLCACAFLHTWPLILLIFLYRQRGAMREASQRRHSHRPDARPADGTQQSMRESGVHSLVRELYHAQWRAVWLPRVSIFRWILTSVSVWNGHCVKIWRAFPGCLNYTICNNM